MTDTSLNRRQYLMTLPCVLGATAVVRDAGATSSVDAASLALRLLTAFAERDLDALMAAMASDVVIAQPYALPRQPGIVQGRDAVRSFFESMFAQFSRTSFVSTRVFPFADGRGALVETTGDMLLTVGRRPYRNRYVFVLELDQEGRVVMLREYFNPLIVAELSGLRLSPVSGAPATAP